MQKKTIAKVIRKKLEEWLNSITDKQLAKDLMDNILVSGWSITSLFLNEKVNDYDIYLNDMDVLKRVSKYYCTPFDLEVFDGRRKKQYIHDDQTGCFEEWAKENYYNIFINNLKEDQIKIQTEWGQRVNEDKKEEELNYTPVFFSPNAISLSDDIQIVCRFHGNNVQIHKTFDFIHATNYYTFKDGLVTNVAALESILTKQLRYQGSLYPLTTIIRIRKFIKRGWNIWAGELLKVMFQISELNLKDYRVLEEQLIWVDVAYFWTLIKILRGSKKELNSWYLNNLIDKVFDDDY